MRAIKRAFDVMAATGGLIVLAPVLLACGLAVRLTSEGPVLFRQRRVGRHGEEFRLLKFRSMRVRQEQGALQVTVGDDERVTPVGSVLRKYKLDELPQLINVLRGEMSIVGPRPEVPEYVALWDAAARAEILNVRPGITDAAAIQFRDESELLARQDDPEHYYRTVVLPKKVELYRDYVRNASFGRDLKYIAKTLVAVVRGGG